MFPCSSSLLPVTSTGKVKNIVCISADILILKLFSSWYRYRNRNQRSVGLFLQRWLIEPTAAWWHRGKFYRRVDAGSAHCSDKLLWLWASGNCCDWAVNRTSRLNSQLKVVTMSVDRNSSAGATFIYTVWFRRAAGQGKYSFNILMIFNRTPFKSFHSINFVSVFIWWKKCWISGDWYILCIIQLCFIIIAVFSSLDSDRGSGVWLVS